MMRQYAQIKAENPDCLILFRLGDFYELFEEDAKIGSEILGIVLTSRDGKVPMAGVPHHALDQYLNKLISAGHKVAICEQVTEPDGRGLVERAVIRVVTPGTVLDEHALNSKENNFLVAIEPGKKEIALAVVDLSTGEFRVTAFSGEERWQSLLEELARLKPAEGILSPKTYNNLDSLQRLRVAVQNLQGWTGWENEFSSAETLLKSQWQVQSLEGFGIASGSPIVQAAASLLRYLQETQKSHLDHLQQPQWYTNQDSVILDRSTIHNLELFQSLYSQETHGSLIAHIDRTKTAFGGRLLRQWLRSPLRNIEKIQERLDAVSELLSSPILLAQLQTELEGISDMERILSRFATGQGNARDLIRLRSACEHAQALLPLFENSTSPLLYEVKEAFTSEIQQLHTLIAESILDEPAFDPKSGGILRAGVNDEIDELRNAIRNTQDWILELERTERERTGISTLKIRSNKVFGFYIEVTTAHKNKVPENYERKQTLVNGERFITPELKEKEAFLLTAEEEGNRREYEFFLAVVKKALQSAKAIQKLSHSIAQVDCLQSFAQLAQEERYVQPTITAGSKIIIEKGRHPVVEKLVAAGRFVPNDTMLDNNGHQVIVLTGPNMAGKSVYMRQVAQIVLLAHIGCFVPAKRAEISLVDRIFVRSGASDVISAGLSTFMLEMVESATILRHATDKSLIIMDEIGRGTSTYDGISLAWSIAEYLAKTPGKQAKTLFATHYHELQTLAEEYPEHMKNMHLAVKQENHEPIFLYSLVEGGASHSFGIAVAKLAGVPQEITHRADELLQKLEAKTSDNSSSSYSGHAALAEKLKKLDISQMTPLQALNTLAEFKETC
jgi:DNA mismatch repair protein MutS